MFRIVDLLQNKIDIRTVLFSYPEHDWYCSYPTDHPNLGNLNIHEINPNRGLLEEICIP